MKVNNISVAVMAYAESQMISKIESSFGRWATYTGMLLGMPKLEKTIEKFLPMLQSSGVISADGDIDLEKLRTVGLAAFDKIPTVQIADFDFDRNDFESFISFLATQA